MNRRAIATALAVCLATGILVTAFWPAENENNPAVTAETGASGREPVRHEGSLPAAPTSRAPSPAAPVPPPPSPERATMAAVAANGANLLPGAQELAAELNEPANTPEEDIVIVASLVGQYQKIFGQNPPGGLNAEIVASMTGKNAKRLAIIPPDFSALNASGELIDRWGTPFVFHPVSRTIMEILSAGPDRMLWTADDVGTLTPANAELPPGPVDQSPFMASPDAPEEEEQAELTD